MSNGSDFLWSVYEPAVGDIGSLMRGYAQHITQAPVDDAARQGLPVQNVGGTAVIPLMGLMLRRAGRIGRMFGLAGTEEVREALNAALEDDDVRQIVLRVDSPGGSVSGLDLLADAINGADKPIVAQVEGMAASAAYYVASQADRMYVGRNDLVGSIGTRLMLYDYSKAFEEMGVEAVPIDTGEYKSAGALGTEITENQRADFQRIVDFYFEDFLETVGRGRNMDREQVREWADGRMFVPREAIKAGLVDGVRTLDETMAEMREAATGRSTDAARAKLRI